MHKTIGLLICLTLLKGCYTEPEFVFVPNSDYNVDVRIKTDTTRAKVGELIELLVDAEQTGTFRKVRRAELPAETCYESYDPATFSAEELSRSIEMTVGWKFEPAGSQRMTIGTIDRAVKFTRPGIYKIWAFSASNCGPKDGWLSNSIEVEISE